MNELNQMAFFGEIIAIEKSLVLPFRFYDAYKNVSDRNIKIALSKAADLSVANVPKLPGRTLIAIDVSGSMSGKAEEIARMFGAVLFKALDSDVITFDSRAKYENLNPADSVFSIMDGLYFRGGGTNFNSIFDIAHKPYDRIFILSDMQAWVHGGWHSSIPTKAKNAYNSRYGVNPMIYSFDLRGYGTLQFPEKQIVALAGFSDKIFELIGVLEQDRQVLVKRISEIKL